ncbi:MAG: YtxH domain-containing protein [Actinomycetota bacterium]|nr:YtxH domain-containing protein [Actinomycetota bacterium]
MKVKHFGAAEFGVGLLSGALLGVAVGVMMAPSSGIETRMRISRCANGLIYSAADLFEQAKSSIDIAALQLEKVVGLQERSLRRRLNSIKAQLEEFHLNEA